MNILDTRDLEERREELETDLQTLDDIITEEEEALLEAQEEDPEGGHQEEEEALLAATDERAGWLDENQEELDELNRLAQEVGEWADGNALIEEGDFTEYAQELAEDIGAVGDNSGWITIDWEDTADNLKADYSEIEYQGTTYLYRDC